MMKQYRKIIIVILSIMSMIGVGYKAIQQVYASMEHVETITITETIYKEDIGLITEYSDGSFSCVNAVKGIFEFTPVECGDWNYTFNDESEMLAMIDRYKATKIKLSVNPETKEKNLLLLEVQETEDGGIIGYYSNGSYSYINENHNLYIFYPVECGGWGNMFDSSADYNNALATYTMIYETGSY